MKTKIMDGANVMNGQGVVMSLNLLGALTWMPNSRYDSCWFDEIVSISTLAKSYEQNANDVDLFSTK